MSLDAAIRKLDTAIQQLAGIVSDSIVVAGNDATSLIINRIRETGTDDKGKKFQPDYTPQYKRFKAGLTVKRIKRAEKQFNKKVSEGTLGQKKSDVKLADTVIGIRGKYKGYVDFSLTNRMLNNIGIIEKDVNKTKVKVDIAPRSEQEKVKLIRNIELRGEILRLSEKEFKAVGDSFYKRVETKLKQFMP
jgi:hypothetical protein